MKIEIYGKPQFCVPFTKRLVEAMIICADVHYDGHCKAQAKSGPLNRAMNMMRGLDIDSYNITMEFRELDTLMKVCENFPEHLITIPQRIDIKEFVNSGLVAMHQANIQSKDWKFTVED
jgi:hypothetical protein